MSTAQEQQEKFEAWAVVDLFGHQRLAGLVTEQQLGGETFIRVDVPKNDGYYTRLFGKGAIYSLSLVDETIAREVAKRHEPAPVHRFELQHLLPPGEPIERPMPSDYDLEDEGV